MIFEFALGPGRFMAKNALIASQPDCCTQVVRSARPRE